MGVGINLLPWWRVYHDAGYRYISIDPRIIEAANADSFTLQLSFAIGKFGQ